MNSAWTLAGLAASLLIMGLAIFSLRRKRPFGQLRLIPWEGILFVAIVAFILFARHMLDVMGIGPPPR